MSDSRAASAVWLWPLMPFGPEGPRASVLKACSKPPGSIIKTHGDEHEWLYRPFQSEMDRVATVDPSGSGENPAWGEVVKAAMPGRDTTSIRFMTDSLYWDVSQIVAKLPDVASPARTQSPAELAKFVSTVREAVETFDGHELIESVLEPTILTVHRSMRVLGIEWKTDLSVLEISTFNEAATALKDAEESIRNYLEHYVTNVGAQGPEKVQNKESTPEPEPDLVSESGRLKAWKTVVGQDERWRFEIDGEEQRTTPASAKVVVALLKNPKGLSKPDLESIRGVEQPLKALIYLVKTIGGKWPEVICMPGAKSNGGYRINSEPAAEFGTISAPK